MFTLTEVRNAVRALSRAPTVTVSAVLCLALGIGATTAISSAVSRALLRPLPLRDADRLVAVHRTTPQSGPQGTWPQSAPNYMDLARNAKQIEQLSVITPATALVNLTSEAVQVSQLYVSGGLFGMVGARAEVGRLIGVDDDRLDAPLAAVISDEFWRTKLGGDPSVVGRSLVIDGEPTTIVGILPPEFRIPHGGNLFSADIWMPVRFTPQNLARRRSNYLFMLGRLARGATVQSADAEMHGLFANLIGTYPELRGENLRVAPLQSENLASIRTPLLLLFGAVCMVLLIAATNVAALLLARGVQRRRETAVRAALGATRWDTMRPALIESFVITLAGVVLGIALAAGSVKTIGSLAAARMPQLAGLGLDLRVLAFALVLAIVVAIACGAVPAWRTGSVDPQDALRGGRGGGSGREHHRALEGLVVLEICLSLVLLIGAGLVLKGFAQLVRKDPGFDPSHILTMRVTASAARYPNGTSVKSMLEPSLAAIRGVPGVQDVASISLIPYVNWGNNSNIRYEGMSGDDPTRLPLVEERRVTPSFFGVTKQRLLSGRLLTDADDDRPQAPPVVVVNEALAKRDFAGKDAVGKRFYISDTSFATIVGVVSDIRNAGPIADPQPEMYWTYRQGGYGSSFPLMIRVAGDPTSVVAGVRAALHGVDPSAAISSVHSMPEVIATSLGRPRFYFSLLGSFAAIAILLALAGLYGVLSYAVAQRTREIGIRAALGSPRSAILRLVTGHGMRLVAGGIVLGLLAGAGLTRLMVFMLYGVSPLDATTWAGAALLMIAAGVAASVVPARRAARVDPLVAMQAE